VAKIICGVDVSSEALDVCIGRNGACERFAQSPAGIDALAAFCRQHDVAFVAMEATGGYEKFAFSRLWQSGIPVAIVNPRSVRRFAEGMGILEKTDAIDSGVIAWYAEVKGIVPQEPAREVQDRLGALVTRLRQLTDMKVAQSNQRRLVTEGEVLATFEELMAVLVRQIRAIEVKIAALIEQDPLWAKLDEAFRTVKGVADRTVARLMAEMPEIGTISNKAIAKLAGLAPIARDSGKAAGRRAIRGGRTPVRSILFVVAAVVRKHDPDFADFNKRLTEAGKPKKAIRIALARKLLVRLNAKARDARRDLVCAT
jgi:transposase